MWGEKAALRYLKKDEFERCLPLWQEAFPEDSKEFTDYYFHEKLKKSRILVKEGEDGRILTMAHLNPYRLMVKDKELCLDYIVGVATRADSRRQGHMKDLLEKLLRDMAKQSVPFCYLMPAAPDIYRPFGFEMIWDGKEPEWGGQTGLRPRLIRLDENTRFLSDWMNRWLSQRFQVYALRDEAYLKLLQKELESEDGQVWGWFDENDRLRVMEAVWGRQKKSRRFLYKEEMPGRGLRGLGELPDQEDTRSHILLLEHTDGFHPSIMARITDLNEMLSLISLKKDSPQDFMEVPLRIHDGIISKNEGLWLWRLDKHSSSVRRKVEGEQEADTLMEREILDIHISKLTQWLFGYQELPLLLRDGASSDTHPVPPWHPCVETLSGVFLDEVV